MKMKTFLLVLSFLFIYFNASQESGGKKRLLPRVSEISKLPLTLSVMIVDPPTGNYGLAEIKTDENKTSVCLQIEPGNAIILKTSKEKILNDRKWNYIDSVGEPIMESGLLGPVTIIPVN
jgi:hypothetical protein